MSSMTLIRAQAHKLLSLCFLILPMALLAQHLAIGQWRTHLPWIYGVAVADASSEVWCATQQAVFSYDKDMGGASTFTKVNALSEVGVRTLNYDRENGYLLVAYSNSNIDLVKGNTTINISDIKRKSIVGDKNIYHVYFIDNRAYLSTGFGIVVLDMDKEEVSDTYVIGTNGDNTRVNAVTSDGQKLYAATQEGVMEADLNNPNLTNYENWSKHDSAQQIPAGESQTILYYNNKLITAIKDTLFEFTGSVWQSFFNEPYWKVTYLTGNQEHLVLTQLFDSTGTPEDGRVVLLDKQHAVSRTIENTLTQRPQQAVEDAKGIVWVADLWKGLVRIEGNNFDNIVPDGPKTTNVYAMGAKNNNLWVGTGGEGGWVKKNRTDGVFKFSNSQWDTYDRNYYSPLDSITDIMSVAFDPRDDRVYFGSYGGGLVQFKDGVFTVYKQNSAIGPTIGNESTYRVSGLAFDKNNNLWISVFGAQDQIVVWTADGEWQSFKPTVNIVDNVAGPLIVDSWDQKWMILPLGHGILVWDHGDDVLDANDDVYRKLGLGENNGNLPSTNVFDIVEDHDGEVWIGTDKGIAVFYCPGDVLTERGCDADQIFVTVDGFDAFLMETEEVLTIAIDGANRKWIGTRNGAWLMSEDGTQQIHHFTTENSPLLSNVIKDIEINHVTGEVFFGTEMGIISYQSDATGGQSTHTNVEIFPNPVTPDHLGTIAIRGLVDNADVRITDVSGTLIYRTKALGGQAVWDGINYSGDRAKSGVYLVFSTNQDGKETNVGKFLIIN